MEKMSLLSPAPTVPPPQFQRGSSFGPVLKHVSIKNESLVHDNNDIH